VENFNENFKKLNTDDLENFMKFYKFLSLTNFTSSLCISCGSLDTGKTSAKATSACTVGELCSWSQLRVADDEDDDETELHGEIAFIKSSPT